MHKPYRRYIQEVFKIIQETARRTSKTLFVILVDLDGFKAINDQQGHVQGDRVLCEAALALKSALRQSDVLGRHGGDEFILVGLADRESAGQLVERAKQAVYSKTRLGLSFGIGFWPGDGETAEELVAAADRALGKAKKASHESRTLPRIPSPKDS